MEEIDREILVEFIKETIEELDGLDAKFIELENNPSDSETINAIFRTMHSIKGSASFFNLNHIRNFSHKLENLLDELRKGARKVTKDIINILLEGKDYLDGMFDRLVNGDMGVELFENETSLLEKVDGILATEEEKEEVKPHHLFHELDKMRHDLDAEEVINKPSVAGMLEIIERLREVVLGPEAKGEKDAPPLGQLLVEEGVVTSDDVSNALSKQKRIGEILIEEGKATPDAIARAAQLQEKQNKEISEAKRAKPVPSSAVMGIKKSMRIEEEKIDNFMDAVGELIINAEVFNYLQKKLETGHEIEKLVAEFKNASVDFSELIFNLQKGLAEVRKVSLKGIFQKVPRMVRDLAEKIGKEVDVQVSGEELLVDKSLYEQLESPLNHIIRNAIDHGVELPDDRKASGKNPTGKIIVSAEEVSGDFVISIIDDGKGMDAETLKAKALEKGIITPQMAEVMSDKEAYKLIFAPGFSTAEKVTDVSGRGVGMDVVMTALKEIKGKIDINTEVGRGTELMISVPMSTTLITISGLVVAVGKEHYIVPMEWVRESIKPSREQITSVKHQGDIIQIREQIYPLFKLFEVFGIVPASKEPWESVVMVIEKEDQQCCLVVDEIIEETQVVLKDLGDIFSGIPGILGGAILGDGKIGLVINIEGILNSMKNRFNTINQEG